MVYTGAGEQQPPKWLTLCGSLYRKKNCRWDFRHCSMPCRMKTIQDADYWRQIGCGAKNKQRFRNLFSPRSKTAFGRIWGWSISNSPKLPEMLLTIGGAEKTNQKIKELFKPGSIDPQLRMVLTNAIYFKGHWAQPFDRSATQQKPFYAKDKEIMAQMMYRRGIFRYVQNNEMQILEKPYLGNYLSMVILLPKEPGALAELEKSLTAEKLKDWSHSLMEQEVEVLSAPIQNGCKLRLDPQSQINGNENRFRFKVRRFHRHHCKNRTRFGSMRSSIVPISKLTKKGPKRLRRRELGTFGGPPPPAVFRANHPFVFLIRDKRTDCILFMGRVMEPQSE